MDARKPSEVWNYQQIALGFNYRMTDIQAALGISQLTRLDKFVLRRREIAKYYDERLPAIGLEIPWQSESSFSSYHLYPVKCGDGSSIDRNSLYHSLHELGLGVNIHYIPIHRHPFFEKLGFREGDFPQSESYFNQTISLPIFYDLSDESVEEIVESIQHIIFRRGG